MITIATFDIETTHLSVDFGVILCAVVKDSAVDAVKSYSTVFNTWGSGR